MQVNNQVVFANLFPFVSVIIPVRNEEENIQRILEQIFNQDYPSRHVEVIVVDGQSEDRTADIASLFSINNRAPIVMRIEWMQDFDA